MIKQKIQSRLYQAMKEKNQKLVDFLRFVLSTIKNGEIDKKRELTDEEIIVLFRKLKAELIDTLSFAKKSEREEVVKEINFQLKVLIEYLPSDLSEEEIKKEIKKIIEENKSLYEKNRMALMGFCIKTLKSKAEAKRIGEVFKRFFL